ncbi:MAG: SRPBCC domain-containing protein [Bacteroidales bacterium]
MENQPIVVERIFDATVLTVWTAITDQQEMKKWYFDLAEFKAEKGFTFRFLGGPDGKEPYVHLCEVIEVIPQKSLTYSWRYEGYTGISFVTFVLVEQEGKTFLRLIHRGIDTFPKENPDLAINNFIEGWNQIINSSLLAYLEGPSLRY